MSNGNPAISIIVPAYNASKYITFCIDSILGQTFRNFELIVVDDVSEDDTYELCERLYGSLECVTLLRNETNMGQWYARNMGIKQAKGKYIYFMDNDDELVPEALEVLYQKAEAERADVVHSNYYVVAYTEDRMLPRRSLWRKCRCRDDGEGMLSGTLAERLEYQASRSMPMPWLNLFRREFLAEEGIEFPKMCFGEDNVFAIEVCLKAKRFVRINRVLYIYRNYFDQKGRMVRRFSKAFDYVPIFLAGWNRIFAAFSEEELPFENRRKFVSSWLMAHLRFCVYDIMNTDDKESFSSIRKHLQPICAGGDEFTTYLINVLEHSFGFREEIVADRARKREKARRLFADLESGRSKFNRDYSYIYSESKLASYIEGGEGSFYYKAYCNLADASLGLGKYQEALDVYEKAASYTQTGSEEFLKAAGKRLAVRYYLASSSEKLSQEYGLYAKSLAAITPFIHGKRKEGWGRKKIRIGLLSPCFCECESFAVYYGLIFCYDKEQFEVYCYHCGKVEDGYTVAVCNQVERFINVRSLSYKERAELIYNDDVDVLLDIAGEELQEAVPVLAYRPALVQIAGFERMPLFQSDFVDYYLTDDVLTPVDGQDAVGKLFRLPCCYSYAMRDDLLPSRRAPALVNGYVTFGVMADYRQINGDMLDLWREIMDRIPVARLLVKAEEFNEQAMIVEAKERFREHGFNLRCVQFEGMKGDCLPRLLDIDILLGTYPVQSGAKLLNALYMGVPVISLYCERSDTRLGLSILSRVGLEELATGSKDAYVEKAVKLANNLPLLDELHKNLRKAMEATPALNPAKYVRHLEMKIREAYTSGRF